jgi:hypothetical protein
LHVIGEVDRTDFGVLGLSDLGFSGFLTHR